MHRKWLYPIAALIVVLIIDLQTPWFGSIFDTFVRRRALIIAQIKDHEYETRFLGIRVRQFPQDYLLYAELIHRLRPTAIVETGAAEGGNAVFLATVLRQVSPKGKVITVDITDEFWNKTVADGLVPEDAGERIEFLKGDSAGQEIVARVRESCGGRAELVILDSLHTREHVARELELYSALVPVGGYLLVNDTHHETVYLFRGTDGPLTAVKEFLRRDDRFECDPDLPSTHLSCMHGGVLRRER